MLIPYFVHIYRTRQGVWRVCTHYLKIRVPCDLPSLYAYARKTEQLWYTRYLRSTFRRCIQRGPHTHNGWETYDRPWRIFQ